MNLKHVLAGYAAAKAWRNGPDRETCVLELIEALDAAEEAIKARVGEALL